MARFAERWHWTPDKVLGLTQEQRDGYLEVLDEIAEAESNR